MLGGEGREGGAVPQAAETGSRHRLLRKTTSPRYLLTEAAARAGARRAEGFDKGGGVEAAATEAGRAASLTAMARGLSITDAGGGLSRRARRDGRRGD